MPDWRSTSNGGGHASLRTAALRALLLLCTLAPLAGVSTAAAQAAAGRIVGRVVDAETGRGLPGAQVSVVGSTVGTLAGPDGRYLIARVPAGEQSLRVQLLGYGTKTVTGISVAPDAATSLDVALATEAVALEGITVSAARERGTVSRVLDEQRTAVNVTSGISQQEIQRGPDDNAAEAVQRVSGVTVEDGKYVFVRGLGERYTTTSLNGARLPSPEPDRRRVPLDLFPAGTLEGISVSKTFTPDQSGDFTGAQVDLRTRTFDADPFTSFSLSLGYNDAVTFGDVLLAPTERLDWLALGSADREMPGVLETGPNLSDTQQAQALRGFRNVWTPESVTARPNFSLSASAGNGLGLGGREIRYLAALSYKNSTEAQLDEIRATPVLRGETTEPLNEYRAQTGRRSVLWGGVLNLATELAPGHRLQFNNTYDRTADNEALRLSGFDEELATDLDITRLQYVERSILATQLRGSHLLDLRNRLEWSGAFSRVTRDEPDRSEFVRAQETDFATGERLWAFFGAGTAPTTRAFSDLAEHSATLGADHTYSLRRHGPAKLRFGGLFRYTARDAQTQSFDLDNARLSLQERAQDPGVLFGGQHFSPDGLGIRLRSNIFGGTYTATEGLAAAYAMVEYPLAERLELVGGARVENAQIDVEALDVIGTSVPAELDDTDLLPALALNYRVSPDQNVRFSAARTLSRPEYRELANITYRDYVGSFLVFGYPGLQRALIDNLDLRWELYPTGGEVVSVALFGKRFQNPIERVVIPATGAPVLSFRNAHEAYNYGVEVEFRRRLGFLSGPLEALTASANATLVRSEVDFGETDAAASATSGSRPLLGQAPYVVNLGLTYTAPSDGSATLLFNVVGERITEVGLGGIPDAYEQPRQSLDLAAEYPVLGGATLRFEASNLLDAETEILQGGVTRVQYKTGRTFSVGVSLRP